MDDVTVVVDTGRHKEMRCGQRDTAVWVCGEGCSGAPAFGLGSRCDHVGPILTKVTTSQLVTKLGRASSARCYVWGGRLLRVDTFTAERYSPFL
jgi:hypothetical protein